MVFEHTSHLGIVAEQDGAEGVGVCSTTHQSGKRNESCEEPRYRDRRLFLIVLFWHSPSHFHTNCSESCTVERGRIWKRNTGFQKTGGRGPKEEGDACRGLCCVRRLTTALTHRPAPKSHGGGSKYSQPRGIDMSVRCGLSYPDQCLPRPTNTSSNEWCLR